MCDYDLWLKACGESGATIIRVEGNRNTGLYKTFKTRCDVETGWHEQYYDIMYHLWDRGEHIAVPDMREAFALYRSRTKRDLTAGRGG